jgi:hypothetical protein
VSRRRRHSAFALVLCLLLVQCASFGRRITIVGEAVLARLAPNHLVIDLDRSFIEAYKDRVTIRTTFTVDAAASRPNPTIFDGDFHFAGRAPEVGFRLVGEIINAASQDSAVALVRRAESTKVPLQLTGVWRLWPEHALGTRQEQGRPVDPLRNANPEHVFEVHPVTRIGRLDLLESFATLEGYLPGDAKRSFGIYEEARYSLVVQPKRISITTPSGLYNDVRFIMQVRPEAQMVVGDGRFVWAAILDLDGSPLVERLRMVFVRGTPPERTVRSLEPGTRLLVWGKPRVSFAGLSRIIRESARDSTLLEGRLPYEITVLGIYPETK